MPSSECLLTDQIYNAGPGLFGFDPAVTSRSAFASLEAEVADFGIFSASTVRECQNHVCYHVFPLAVFVPPCVCAALASLTVLT